MNIVLDTNVLVSGVINPDGLPARLLNIIINRTLTINADSRILSEYNRVLTSPKFSFPEMYILHLLNYISSESKPVLPNPYPSNLKDPFDLSFVEVALHENIPLITGNKKHFENIENLRLYSPKEFLESFRFNLLR